MSRNDCMIKFPCRLMSLWEIMNLLNLQRLAASMQRLAVFKDRCVQVESDPGGGQVIWIDGVIEQIRSTVQEVGAVCAENGCKRAAADIQLAEAEVDPNRDVSALLQIIKRVEAAITSDLQEFRVVAVASDRSEYIDNAQMFADLEDAFPSAMRDLNEAANCLAVECPTACVFHAMRAAEVALRALAWDRRITIPRKRQIEFATWEEIIKQLETAESEIRNYPQTAAREAQFVFYHAAMMEFRAFKNIFRNPGMHSRGRFNRDEAKSALHHVHDFMRMLAPRIGEGRRTPKVWKRI